MIDLKKDLEEIENKINSGKLSFDLCFSLPINIIANKIIEIEKRILKLEENGK